MSKDRLQWVTITSPQAIMMSICLQSMVDELMVKKSGGSIRKMLRRRVGGTLRRSDSQQAVKSPPLLESPDASRDTMVKLSSKLSAVSLRELALPVQMPVPVMSTAISPSRALEMRICDLQCPDVCPLPWRSVQKLALCLYPPSWGYFPFYCPLFSSWPGAS